MRRRASCIKHCVRLPVGTPHILQELPHCDCQGWPPLRILFSKKGRESLPVPRSMPALAAACPPVWHCATGTRSPPCLYRWAVRGHPLTHPRSRACEGRQHARCMLPRSSLVTWMRSCSHACAYACLQCMYAFRGDGPKSPHRPQALKVATFPALMNTHAYVLMHGKDVDNHHSKTRL